MGAGVGKFQQIPMLRHNTTQPFTLEHFYSANHNELNLKARWQI